jgi:hypothetical protein
MRVEAADIGSDWLVVDCPWSGLRAETLLHVGPADRKIKSEQMDWRLSMLLRRFATISGHVTQIMNGCNSASIVTSKSRSTPIHKL